MVKQKSRAKARRIVNAKASRGEHATSEKWEENHSLRMNENRAAPDAFQGVQDIILRARSFFVSGGLEPA
ncbi:hypothetical protein CU102_17105 [Phyllobacterium brassicacearum]|uniref:Uncharacterized protein n=1 Tax=Phyllobacterium brassicacearum TaxID=314235 RepID=A0A2P7BMB6_9HYPH|nr:hypothetical protein CU102_17105 [Phyllobacterium brassicacearum]